MKRDLTPWLLLPAVALIALPMMSLSAWATLTVAGVAMGMMLFLMASGLTLVFGLMDVLNFAHGAFVTIGAFIAATVLGHLSGLAGADSLALNLLALALAVLAGALASGTVGFAFERVIIRHVYGSHMQQILITMGGMIMASQLIIVLWGAQPLQVPKPATLRGSLLLGGSAVETYRLVAVALGVILFAAIHTVLNRTRIGLLIRAGVENREMVEALGFRIRRLFIGVFVAGSALAGIGGVMWGIYQEIVTVTVGDEMTVLVFIVVIIGGLGSITGCFQAAILVGLTANYVGYLTPKLALGSNILLMVIVLLWRPRGLFPVARQ
jgi:branched-chain amino acid transport system permease protein